MTRIIAGLALLLVSTTAVRAEERLFKPVTAESVLSACQDQKEQQHARRF